MIYVQYGCGLSAPDGWRNFDASPVVRLNRMPGIGRLVRNRRFPPFPRNVEYGDVVRGLPIHDMSVDGIYCSHVLEHLSLGDLRVALRNTHRYLRPGGTFRLVVPDLEKAARDYLQSDDERAAHHFMSGTMLGRASRPRGPEAVLRHWIGNSEHLWMWDFKALSVELRDAGFSEIRRASFNDSAQPAFGAVEDADRWTGALGVECVRKK